MERRSAGTTLADLAPVLALWQRAEAAAEEYILATVVGVEGSSYRKPGARMLLTTSGGRAGTISGGCLEGEVSKKAWWLTREGASLQTYSTFFDIDGNAPYGLGCGGTVRILLQRPAQARPVLRRLQQHFESRVPGALATALGGPALGDTDALTGEAALTSAALDAAHEERSAWLSAQGVEGPTEIFAEFLQPRQGLFVFGAGDDALPLTAIALTLGWHVVVADGRANLPTPARFPAADRHLLTTDAALETLALRASDAAVLMTHSYEQDRRLLRFLLPLELRYVGVLGPRVRTRHLASKVGPELGLEPETCLGRLHSPAGLDLGAETPAAIALSIVAEIEQLSHQARAENATTAADGANPRSAPPLHA